MTYSHRVHPEFQGTHLSGLRTVTARDFDALAPHVASWDRLAWEAPQKMPTLLPGWTDAFLRHRLMSNERWFCSFAYAGDRLVGVLPVIITPHAILGRGWPLLRSPFDSQTWSGDLPLAPDLAAAAFQALLAEVGREVPTHLGLDLMSVRQTSPVWTALQDGVDGYIVRRGARVKYSFLNVEGDFGAYLASLGKMRRNLRIGRKRLESHGAVSVDIRKGSAVSEDFLAEFLDLEASGWKGRNGTAIANSPAATAFFSRLVRNFAAQGRFEWHAIRVEGRLVVAGMGTRCGASLMLPKYAFDEDFVDCMPGSLLTEEIFKDAFSRAELTEINHMSDAMSDRLWHMPCDAYVDAHLIRRAVLPMVSHLPHIAAWCAYQDHVRPRIPAALKEAWREYRRRGGRRPPPIRDTRSAQSG